MRYTVQIYEAEIVGYYRKILFNDLIAAINSLYAKVR